MIYIKRYDTYNDFVTNEHSVSGEDEYVSSIVPGIAGIRSDLDAVWFNQVPSNAKMTVAELIAAGYAEQILDTTQTDNNNGNYRPYVIQIHSNCPIRLKNITDFDEQLVSSVTFVWREALPSHWNPSELAAKYDTAELARPPMEQMFSGVDMGSVDTLNLSFTNASWFINNSSILTNRYVMGNVYPPTPKHVIVSIRNGD